MSVDSCEIFFSTVDKTLTSVKIKNKIAKVLQKKGMEISSISSSKLKDVERDRCLVLEIDSADFFEKGVLHDLLICIDALPKEQQSYAVVSYEELYDNEKTYHCIVDENVANFSSLADINEHLTQNLSLSPEQLFISEFGKQKNLMLIKLQISAKTFKNELLNLCSQYIADNSDANFNELKLLLDNNATKQSPLDFPNLVIDEHWKAKGVKGICDVQIVQSMCFCSSDKNNVLLGFMSKKLGSSRKKVLSGETNAMNLVDAFMLCKSIKSSRAKLWGDFESSKQEWAVYSINGVVYSLPTERLPVVLWSNPQN